VICDNSTADKVAAVVEQCPSGALHYVRKDGGAAEIPDEQNALLVSRDGPLFIRGELELLLPDGSVSKETRLTLCRCGASTHKPYCDNSHLRVHFEDSSKRIPAGELGGDRSDAGGPLRIEPQRDGPLQLSGNLRILDAAGVAAGCSTEATFCRCGHSGNKPFCDGSHVTTRFSSD
jgi:CDGSH-type Zn-finger protein